MTKPPIAVEVREVAKTFRMPSHRLDTFRERVVHPLQRREYTALTALRGVSFDVARGEFFGIVGRNGSGKTTLLKLLSSIYRPDRGRIRVAGRIAPFIELGVGFNPELAARDNVLLNGVMMGLTPTEARRRFNEVIEFAELEEFAELKLKNYSSGMRVRLAFAVMVQADADIMLVDEVLAVGDARFQRKCAETFRELHARGRTILLVTHSMVNLQEFCDRALLLEHGEIQHIGPPDDIASRYIELSREAASVSGRAAEEREEPAARLGGVWVGDGREAASELEPGAEIHLHIGIDVLRELESPLLSLELRSGEGTLVFSIPAKPLEPAPEPLTAGDSLTARVTLANPLTPGRYAVNCTLASRHDPDHILDFRPFALTFTVLGEPSQSGVVELDYELDVDRERASRMASP